MFNNKLKIDEVDKMIITLLQENPEMTHSEISSKVHKSQPAVGARIIKLRRKNLLCTQMGVNFKEIDIKLGKVEMLVKNVEIVLQKVLNCPFILHAFKISGSKNLCTLIAAPDIKTIDKMVDQCFRKDTNVQTIEVSYIISSIKDLILPINFDIEHFDNMGCGKGCYVNNGEIEKLREMIKESQESAFNKEITESSEE